VKYRVRFNKSRGQPGRGTVDHVWRVFDETGKEWLCKNVVIETTVTGEKEENSDDWNMVTEGMMVTDKTTSTIHII
jgi:hypothetical protein